MFPDSSAGFQSLRLDAARRLHLVLLPLLLVSFGSLRRRRHLAASSQVSLLPPLLHLADVLSEECFQSRDELRQDLQVAEANLQQEIEGKKKVR